MWYACDMSGIHDTCDIGGGVCCIRDTCGICDVHDVLYTCGLSDIYAICDTVMHVIHPLICMHNRNGDDDDHWQDNFPQTKSIEFGSWEPSGR